jgi:acyl-CoA thioesterase-1
MQRRRVRICFFGDSFTNGSGDDDCLGWVGRICAAARQSGVDMTCYNLGIRRDTSADIARRWKSEAQARLPSLYDERLVFSFGTNDCANDDTGRQRVPLALTLSNARAILSEASAWKPTLMLGPMPVQDEFTGRMAVLSPALETLCREISVPYLDLLPVAASIDALWRSEVEAGDGVHPNRGAYARIAEAVQDWPAWQNWIKH